MRLPAESVTTGAKPVPLKAIDCGEVAALSVICTLPVRLPIAVGLKATPSVQLTPTATVVPQVFAVTRKSPALVPPVATDAMVNGPVPVFFNVTVWLLQVVPTSWLPNVRLIVESVTIGVESVTIGAVPLPATTTA